MSKRRTKGSTSARVKREPQRLSREPQFVTAVADLLLGEDKGSKQAAEIVLSDIETRYPNAARLTKEQLLYAIKKGRRKGYMDLDRVVVEIRKLIYGYSGDPDWVTEVPIATGGMTNR